MSDTNARNVKLTGEERERVDAATPQSPILEGPLHTESGQTRIDDRVVEKITEIAAREIDGVYAMGSSAQRTISNLAGRVTGNVTAGPSGVAVKKGEVQASIDLTIVVEYGYSIVQVADSIRAHIIQQVETMTGLEVVEVNIDVTDVHVPGDDKKQNDDHVDDLK